MKKKDTDDRAFYGVVKISHNGQVIIPAELRKELGMKKGDQLVVAKTRDNDIVFIRMEKLDALIREYGMYGLKDIM